MARIKITGYIDTDELEQDEVDTSHEMGLSVEGYEAAVGIDGGGGWSFTRMNDVEFVLEK